MKANCHIGALIVFFGATALGRVSVRSVRDVATIEAHREAINALAFTANGKMLASSSKDKTIKLWGVTPGN